MTVMDCILDTYQPVCFRRPCCLLVHLLWQLVALGEAVCSYLCECIVLIFSDLSDNTTLSDKLVMIKDIPFLHSYSDVFK